MPTRLKDIGIMVLDLPVRSRAILADLLLESLDETVEDNVEEAWLKTVEKRDSEMRTGEVKAVSHKSLLETGREELLCSH